MGAKHYKDRYGTEYCVDGDKVCIKVYCTYCSPPDNLEANVWVRAGIAHKCKEGGNLTATLVTDLWATPESIREHQWKVTNVKKCGEEP